MSDAADAKRELGRLLSVRTTAHRLDAGAPMTSVGQLQEWLGVRGMALVSGKSAVPNAAEAIAGCQIEGSWWGHPEGSRIYRILNELEDGESGIDELALVEGKRTLLEGRLMPIVLAVACDRDRRRRVIEGLRDPARKLFSAITAGSVVRSDDPGSRGNVWRSARVALESGLLARSTSEHTAAGHHVSLLQEYGGKAPVTAVPAAATTSGLAELFASALGSAVVARRTEVEKWFRLVEPDPQLRSDALSRIACRTIAVDGRAWLTTVEY
jgi:hypothetical protein